MDKVLLAAAEATDKQINALRKAFGAPGDYGYETPKGKALFELYKSQVILRDAMGAAPYRECWQDTLLGLLREWMELNGEADRARLLVLTRDALSFAEIYNPTIQPPDEPFRHEG